MLGALKLLLIKQLKHTAAIDQLTSSSRTVETFLEPPFTGGDGGRGRWESKSPDVKPTARNKAWRERSIPPIKLDDSEVQLATRSRPSSPGAAVPEPATGDWVKREAGQEEVHPSWSN